MSRTVRMRLLAAATLAASITAHAAWSAEVQPWGKPQGIPAESELFRDRLEEPQNHFLLDGTQGFVSGREFYQATGGLWPGHW